VRFYFDFSNYFKMLRLAWGERNGAARRYSLFVLLVPVPLVSSFHAICFMLDGVFFPSLRKAEIRKPVFVIGHARSGTTLVHRLMSRDESRFSSFMLYELYFPSLLQKKMIRFFARVDREHLAGRIAKRVRRWEDDHYAAIRGVHEMGLTQPEEDDLVFYYSLASGFWITKMPYMGDLDFYYVDRWSERKRKRLMRFYVDCIRRQLVLNGTDRVHLSKNPIFAGRVEALIEAFPDARIVVPVRNPNETIPSLLALLQSGWKRLGWDAERVNRCLGIIAEQSFHTYRYPLEVLSQHPETARAVVDYRELLADPVATIGQVYRELGIEMSADYRETLESDGVRSRKHVSTHSYSLEEFGLDGDEIRTQLTDLFERFGWDRDGGGV